MGVYGERTRRKITEDEKGVTGTKTYVADWSSIEPVVDPSIPVIGDIWNAYNPMLVCVNREFNEVSPELGEVVCQYSTQGRLTEEFMSISQDHFTETIDQTKGYTWETAQTKVEIDIPMTVSLMKHIVRIKDFTSPKNAILAAQNCVNSKIFHEIPVGQLRFDGASVDESYNIDGSLLAVTTVYTFVAREFSHQYCWREALPSRDASGQVQYYQSADAAAPNYSTDPKLVGTVVYVTGTAGTAAWDKPKLGALTYRYATCDFHDVLGIPKMAGDG